MPFCLPRPFASFAGYRASWLPSDAAAAVTLAAIAVPEQIATARLIGMPPAAGLLAFAAGSLAFAVVGSHRQLSVGADSTIAPVAAGALAAVAAAGTVQYGAAAATLALMVGGILVLTGVFRLGWIAQLLSIPVTTGFLLGIAVHIVVGELPGLLGIAAPAGTLPARLAAIAARLGDAGLAPMAIGFGTLALCLVAERIDQRVPGPMLALILAGLVAWKLSLAARGLAMLEPLPPVIPAPDLHVSAWRDAAGLLTVALMVALLCMMQTSSVLQAFPPPEGEREDAGREFAAVGAGSILAGLVGGFPVDASPPRTAIAAAAGGRSQAAGVLAVAIVLAVAWVAGDALAAVPHAALSGILIYVAVRLVRVRTMRTIRAQSPGEAILLAAAAALVIVFPIDIGAGLAIGLSVLHVLYSIARPQPVELARVPGTTVWWTVEPKAPQEHVPGVLVFALGAPLSFMNIQYLLDRLNEAVAAKVPPCRLVVMEASGVVGIDFTAAERLAAAVRALREAGVDVAIARLESERARTAALHTGIVGALGADHVFRSVEEAVRALPPGGPPG